MEAFIHVSGCSKIKERTLAECGGGMELKWACALGTMSETCSEERSQRAPRAWGDVQVKGADGDLDMHADPSLSPFPGILNSCELRGSYQLALPCPDSPLEPLLLPNSQCAPCPAGLESSRPAYNRLSQKEMLSSLVVTAGSQPCQVAFATF